MMRSRSATALRDPPDATARHGNRGGLWRVGFGVPEQAAVNGISLLFASRKRGVDEAEPV
ncbi:hypothetical protein BXU08_16930 [Sphingomonas sp. LM7]|jgi:hypothetical protein|nr:hypothetical protein BXU08_16930 [Sphingomonas sp. LM7]